MEKKDCFVCFHKQDILQKLTNLDDNYTCHSNSNVWIFSLVVVQLLSHVWLFATPWTAACQAPLSFTISWSLYKFMYIESVMLYNHLILCHSFSSCHQSSPVSVLFQWVDSGGKVLELQHQSFQRIFRVYFL